MKFYARQGDLVFDNEHHNKPPDGVARTQATAPVILAGRDSAPHQIEDYQAVKMATVGDFTYLELSRDVVCSHAGRHKPVTLKAGELAIFPLSEFDGDLRNVED